MFALSMSPAADGDARFSEYTASAGTIIERGEAAFTAEEWKTHLDEYLAGGLRAVHHSDFYRENEHPAYRIVSRRVMRVLPVLEYIAAHHPAIIAIDGRCASGKSTAAKYLSVILESPVVHMDDFFLPPTLRTEERLAEAGGNVHYERFTEEVLPALRSGEPFSYRIFDCSQLDYNGTRDIPASDIHIVEGSYSHHPVFGEYADLRVFSNIAPDEQMRRIIEREGADYAEVFRTRWIPLEERYFGELDILPQADIVLG